MSTSEVKLLSRVRLFATPWTIAHQAPQSMEFSRQDSWSGLPFPSPADLPNPGIESSSPALKADSQLVKNPPAMQETLVQFLGGEDAVEKAYPFSILGLPPAIQKT